MPFIYNPNEVSAIGQIGQTLRSMQNRDASLALRAAIAQQQQMRMAQRDAMQSGLWEAQSQAARSQAALDASKQAQNDTLTQSAGVLGGLMKGAAMGNQDVMMPLIMEEIARQSALGQKDVPINLSQMLSMSDPNLRAAMATGTKLDQSIAPGHTQVSLAQQQLGQTAPGQPFNQMSTMPSAYGAAVRAMDLYRDPITGEFPGTDAESFQSYQQTKALMDALGQRLQGLVQPGAPAPVAPPPGAQVAPPPPIPEGDLPFINEILRRAQVPYSQGDADTNAAMVIRQLAPMVQGTNAPMPTPPPVAQPAPQTAPVKKPKFRFDPATGQMVPIK